MIQESEKVTLSRAEYQRLCQKASERFPLGAYDSREEKEAALWWTVCREVYEYVGQELIFIPIPNKPDSYVFQWNLQQLVTNKQSESFDTLAIPGEYITEALKNDVA